MPIALPDCCCVAKECDEMTFLIKDIDHASTFFYDLHGNLHSEHLPENVVKGCCIWNSTFSNADAKNTILRVNYLLLSACFENLQLSQAWNVPSAQTWPFLCDQRLSKAPRHVASCKVAEEKATSYLHNWWSVRSLNYCGTSESARIRKHEYLLTPRKPREAC